MPTAAPPRRPTSSATSTCSGRQQPADPGPTSSERRRRGQPADDLLPDSVWHEVMRLLDGASLLACRQTAAGLRRVGRDGALPGHRRSLHRALARPQVFAHLDARAERFVVDILAHMTAVRVGCSQQGPVSRRAGRRLVELVLGHTPRARSLEFVGLDLGRAAGCGLRDRVGGPPLRRLTLESCRLGVPGLAILLAAPSLRDLHELDLDDNDCGDRGVGHLRAASHMTSLTSLSLENNGITDAGLADLCAAGHHGGLRRLFVGLNPVAEAAGLGAASHLRDVDTLSLSATEIDHVDLHALLQGVFAAKLAILLLEDTPLGWGGGEVIARAPQLQRLAILRLGGCSLGPHGVWPLTTGPHLSTLLQLWLDDNDLGDEGAFALGESEALRGLEDLNVRDNGISEAGGQCLARGLFIGPQLSRLELSGNPLSRSTFLAAVANPCFRLAALRRSDLAASTSTSTSTHSPCPSYRSWFSAS